MIGYIYRIICLPTKKCYVGITKNYKKRMQKHIKELNNGTHHSPKLLNAWRYYGEENFMKETDFLQIVYKRQLNQGGCEKAYLLTQEEYNFAFAAQELGFKYTPVAICLGIKPNTVKDWFNGRAREQSRDIYRSLSENEKNEYKQKVQNAHLEAVGKDKFINKREEDVVSFLCYDQFYPQNDAAIQRLFQWSEGTCYGMRKPNRYPITKAKVALLSEEIKRNKADELQARLLSSGPIKIAE